VFQLFFIKQLHSVEDNVLGEVLVAPDEIDAVVVEQYGPHGRVQVANCEHEVEHYQLHLVYEVVQDAFAEATPVTHQQML